MPRWFEVDFVTPTGQLAKVRLEFCPPSEMDMKREQTLLRRMQRQEKKLYTLRRQLIVCDEIGIRAEVEVVKNKYEAVKTKLEIVKNNLTAAAIAQWRHTVYVNESPACSILSLGREHIVALKSSEDGEL